MQSLRLVIILLFGLLAVQSSFAQGNRPSVDQSAEAQAALRAERFKKRLDLLKSALGETNNSTILGIQEYLFTACREEQSAQEALGTPAGQSRAGRIAFIIDQFRGFSFCEVKGAEAESRLALLQEVYQLMLETSKGQ